MKILALESSTNLASVAVAVDGNILSYESSLRQRSHSEFINQAIDQCLAKAHVSLAEIDFFASGVGPGSFTGIRVAGNVAKSFAYSFKKKMIVCDSLFLLSSQAHNETGLVLTVLNAYKNMVYYALYKNGECLKKPSACFVKDLPSQLNPYWTKEELLCLGEGYIAYEDLFRKEFGNLLIRNSSYSDHPTAERLALEAFKKVSANQTIEWNSFLPLYIRASEAEENLGLR